MSRGTIIYVGTFELPDKGASANRVVSNGCLFNSLGFQTVFLGVNRVERFKGIRVVSGYPKMYETAAPKGTKEWVIHATSVRFISELVKLYPDTIAIVLYNTPYSLLLNVKRTFSSIKTIYDCTEWSTCTVGNTVKSIVKYFDYYLIKKRIGRVADGLIVVSSLMYEAYCCNSNRILIPPLIDLNDDIWHQRKNRNDGIYEFCYAGTPGVKDCLDILVSSFVKLHSPNTKLRIIGVTKDEFIKMYSSFDNLADERIIFMGMLSHEDTLYYVENADCNMILRESNMRNNAGFPTKFAEAFTSGNSIIISDVSDIKMYQSDNMIILDDLSITTVFNAMRKIMEQSDSNSMLRDSFHYERYNNSCSCWLEKLVNGETE